MFRIGGNTFYDQKNKIPVKILEFNRSGIGLIAEFRGIPNGFPNQVEDEIFGEDRLECFATEILDAKYEKTDVAKVVIGLTHLNAHQKTDLL